jgi:hypothetical protein
MPLHFEQYEPKHVPAVRAFDRRMSDKGVEAGFLLPEAPQPFDSTLPLSAQYWLAVDGHEIRGGYLLQWRDFWLRGQRLRVCGFQSPISEGIVDRKYVTIGVQLIRHALTVNPLIYTVGMGGLDRPLARLLKSLRFSLTTVPFLFLVNHGGRFLAEIQRLRSSSMKRFALDAARYSGLGWLAANAVYSVGVLRRDRTVRFQEVSTLDEIADDTWAASRHEYSFLAVRDSQMMRFLFHGRDRAIRIEVWRGQQRVGWAVVLETQMRENRYFGNMRLGVIADCLACPADAAAVIQGARDCLIAADVDLLVANFQHPAWISACRRAGFFPGPSNHGLTFSPELVQSLQPFDQQLHTQIHLTRSDGDGLVNL